jgi:hypothetical protein
LVEESRQAEINGPFRAVALAVAYMRQNIVQAVLGEYFGVSQAQYR